MTAANVGTEFLACRPDGTQVGLREVLQVVDDGSAFAWVVVELEASFVAGSSVSWSDIEPGIRRDEGYRLDWHDLQRIADGIHQTIEIDVFGREAGRPGAARADPVADHDLRISASDGAYWLVSGAAGCPAAVAAVEKARSRWSGRSPHPTAWNVAGRRL